MSRRLATFQQAATAVQVSDRTIANWAGKGYFPVYKVDGHRGHLVDLNEVSAALAAAPPNAMKAGVRRYGPKTRIIPLAATEAGQ